MIEPHQRNVALLVAACFFMENLDGTIVTTAAPRIGKSLHVPPTAIALVVTAYLITLAVFIPLGGWMVSRFGSRRVFLSAIVIFTVASLLCAVSTSFGMLVGMRVVQGVGGALMTPVGRIVALTNIAKQDLLRIISFIVWPGLLAPVLAPLAGGVITTYASWHGIFLINIPLGVIAVIITRRLMPRDRLPRTGSSLDWAGFGLLSAGLGSLTYTAHLLSGTGNAWWSTSLFAAGSVVFLIGAIRHLLHTSEPLIDLRMFTIRTFREAQSGMNIYFLVVGSVPFLIPLLFQTVFGWSPVKSGALVAFVFIGNIGIKPTTTFLLTRLGFRRVLLIASLCVSCSMVAMSQLRSATPIVIIALVLFFNGIARSAGFTAFMSLTLSDVPEERMSHANVLAATLQQLGAGFAIASGAIALRFGDLIARATTAHVQSATSFTLAFILLAIVALIDTSKAARLPRDAGSSITGVGAAEADGQIFVE